MKVNLKEPLVRQKYTRLPQIHKMTAPDTYISTSPNALPRLVRYRALILVQTFHKARTVRGGAPVSIMALARLVTGQEAVGWEIPHATFRLGGQKHVKNKSETMG